MSKNRHTPDLEEWGKKESLLIERLYLTCRIPLHFGQLYFPLSGEISAPQLVHLRKMEIFWDKKSKRLDLLVNP